MCVCLYASAALCYLWQFWQRDRGLMLSGSETSNKTSSAASFKCRPVFQLTLFSWQHQTVCVLSAAVMSKQIPLDRTHNTKKKITLKNCYSSSTLPTKPQPHPPNSSSISSSYSCHFSDGLWHTCPSHPPACRSTQASGTWWCGLFLFFSDWLLLELKLCLEIQHACKTELMVEPKHKWTEALKSIAHNQGSIS